jgi:hypothetical protein
MAHRKLRLRMSRSAERGESFREVLELQHPVHLFSDTSRRSPVVLRREVEDLDLLTLFPVDARLGFLPERAPLDQVREPGGHLEIGVPRIVGQAVAHRPHHVPCRVEPHHVERAIRGTRGAADLRPCQRIDFVELQSESLGVMHHGEHREHDAVRDEVRRVQRPQDVLAQRDVSQVSSRSRVSPSLEAAGMISTSGIQRGGLKEWDPAEACTHGGGEAFRSSAARRAPAMN